MALGEGSQVGVILVDSDPSEISSLLKKKWFYTITHLEPTKIKV